MKGLQEPTMLYRKGTRERLHGVRVDTIIVDAHEVADYLEEGWFRTPSEVKEAEASVDNQEVAIERARQEGARAAREAEQQRLFDEAIKRAYEEGANAERARLAAKSGAPEKAPSTSSKKAS